ncbi:MAG: tetratricopeptide repeat protein, partial [Isosphaeraceae bacterium]
MSSQPGTKEFRGGLGRLLARSSSPIRRRLNLVFLAGLLGIIAAASATVYLLHAYQVQRHLGTILDQARRFEADGETDKAMERLALYVNHRPENAEAWARLARLRDQSTPATANHEMVYETYTRATRLNPGDIALTRRMIDLAIELKRFSDARLHLEELYEAAGGEKAGGSRSAELEDLLGQCDEGESKGRAANSWYRRAIAHDASRVDTYARRARLLRDMLKDPDGANEVIEAMVKANPNSGRAYLERWSYRLHDHLDAADRDLARALELAPDDPDVLLAAAQAAARWNDLAEARRLLERGLKKYPENAGFYLLSASIETQDNHLDRAEAVLRQAVEAMPSNLYFPFLLADLLIGRNKLEGPDGAEVWMARLKARNLREGLLTYLEAKVLIARRQWQEAVPKVNMARTLLAADPTFPGRLNLMLAECLRQTGDEESRLLALRQAADSAEEATRTSAQQALGQALETAGRLDEALSQYTLLARQQPAAKLDLARVSIEATRRSPRGRRQWSEAERRLSEAEKAVPDRPVDLALLRAELQAARGRFAESRRSLESAIPKNPKDLRLRLSLASILESQGEWAEARKTLDRAEKELGGSVDLSLARITALYRQGGDEAKKALASLASTFAALPAAQRPRLLDAQAFAWLQLGDRERARQGWRALVKEQPGNRRVLAELCELAIDAGDHA